MRYFTSFKVTRLWIEAFETLFMGEDLSLQCAKFKMRQLQKGR